jgi:integrase
VTTATKPKSTRRRHAGDGTAYEVAPGNWRGSLPYTDATGRTKRKWVSGKTQAAVNARLRDLRDERDRGEALGRTPTVSEWADRWMRVVRHQVRPSTYQSYVWALDHYIRPTLGTRRLASLMPSDVETVVGKWIDGGLKPSTAMLARRVLSVMLGAAVRDRVIVANPVTGSRPPRQQAVERRSLTPDELKALLAVAADDQTATGPAVELLAATGMRRGELLGLRWSDYDATAGTIRVRRALVRGADGPVLAEPKTSQSLRVIGLPMLAVAALDRRRAAQYVERQKAGAYWAGGDDPVIFSDALGRTIHPVAFGSAFVHLAGKAGLTGVTPHVLRHSVATSLLAAGVPARDVADSLGHSTRVLLRTYAHAVPGSQARVAGAMDKVLA